MNFSDYEFLFLFFRIKSFDGLLKLCGTKEFDNIKSKMFAIERSFREVHINEVYYPPFILNEYDNQKTKIVEDGLLFIKDLIEEEDFQNISWFISNFFRKDILSNLQFEIKTAHGAEDISLEFAENFRFKSKKDSFNLFSLPKENRDIIVPQNNDSFIFAIDYKQFEFRTNLLLLGYEELLNKENLYEEIAKELNLEVSDAKLKIISNLYSPEIKEPKIRDFLNRDRILSKIEKDVFWRKGFPVYVKYDDHDGKKIHSITQSISQYFYIQKLYEIFELLKNYPNSKFIFPLHDSMIFSIHESEFSLTTKILETITNTTYRVKCFVGDNWRDAEEIM